MTTDTTCAYCGATTPATDRVPDVRDHAAWEEMTATHAAACDWMTSRATRLEPFALGALPQIVAAVRALDVSVDSEALDGALRQALASIGVETTPQAVDALRDALSPALTWIVEGGGRRVEYDDVFADDAAWRAARAWFDDRAVAECVGTGPAHAHSEWEVRWTAWVGGEHVVERARVVVSRPRPTLDEARAAAEALAAEALERVRDGGYLTDTIEQCAADCSCPDGACAWKLAYARLHTALAMTP